MAKRYTDTNIFKKAFFRKLPLKYKMLWVFITSDCDHAGIWHKELDIAQLRIGKDIEFNEEEALELFNAEKIRIFPIDNGEKWFIVDFPKFQYGQLNLANRAHKGVVKRLEEYKLDRFLDYECGEIDESKIEEFVKNQSLIDGPLMGYRRVINGPKEKEQEQDKEKVKEKDIKEMPLFEEAEILSSEDNEDKIPPKIDQQAMDEYNRRFAGRLPKARCLSKDRSANIKQRCAEYGVDSIREVYDNIAKSEFLMTGGFCNFAWIFLPRNYLKILEGNYDNQFRNQQPAASRKDTADRAVINELARMYDESADNQT